MKMNDCRYLEKKCLALNDVSQNTYILMFLDGSTEKNRAYSGVLSDIKIECSYLLKVSCTERAKWSLWNWFIMNPSTVPLSRTPRRISPPPTVLSIPHAYFATF